MYVRSWSGGGRDSLGWGVLKRVRRRLLWRNPAVRIRSIRGTSDNLQLSWHDNGSLAYARRCVRQNESATDIHEPIQAAANNDSGSMMAWVQRSGTGAFTGPGEEPSGRECAPCLSDLRQVLVWGH